jgi:spore coat polysaccharide biosynthesis protein SpsF (cytidylyltransferase family)
MSSSRFPGKVLELLGGMPMIVFMVERARRAARLDQVVVITSVDASDDPLAHVLEDHGVDVFRGDLDDVLARYARAAEAYRAQAVVRLTGDCPLVDPLVVDQVVETLIQSDADYASNVDPPTYADGFDVEAFTVEALNKADRNARELPEREHVTLWMRSEGSGLTRQCRPGLVDSSHLRLTVDYPDDLEVVRSLVEKLGPYADQYDILRCLDSNRGLLEVNRHARNEGLAASLSAAV